MNDPKEIFGECISVYTRQQAIDDGVLVDVTTVASEAGFKWAAALTRAVYDRYVEVPEELAGCQDVQGRLYDIAWMLWVAIRTGEIKGECGEFKLFVRMPESTGWQENESIDKEAGEGLRLVTLKAVSGPDDDGKACITAMLPWED